MTSNTKKVTKDSVFDGFSQTQSQNVQKTKGIQKKKKKNWGSGGGGLKQAKKAQNSVIWDQITLFFISDIL